MSNLDVLLREDTFLNEESGGVGEVGSREKCEFYPKIREEGCMLKRLRWLAAESLRDVVNVRVMCWGLFTWIVSVA